MYRLCNWEKSLDPWNWKNDNTIKAKPKSYPKNSLDRFGDDFVRQLLSYHSIDDQNNTIQKRCRHECVSKQFQRVIFDTIDDFYIEDLEINLIKDKDLSDEEFWHKLITFMQKKCPNIQRVVFIQNSLYREVINRRPVFAAIDELRDNWPHLKAVDFGLEWFYKYQSDHQLLQYLFTTFGPLVTHFKCFDESVAPYLTHCSNLSQLSIHDIRTMFTAEDDNQLLAFNRLKNVFFNYGSGNLFDFNAQRFEIFIDYYKTRLRCLKISFGDTTIESQPMVIQFMSRLTEFEELRELGLWFPKEQSFNYSIDGYLKTIGSKCEKLKKLLLSFYSKDTAFNVEIMNAMKYMRRLKRLELALHVFWPNMTTDWTQLQPLNGWPQLTHLAIELWDFPQQLIEEIVSTQQTIHSLSISNCEKQRQLRISRITDNTIDSQWLLSIARLSALQSLSIYVLNREELRFKKSDLKTIIKKCPKMRSIMISGDRFNGEDFDESNDCEFFATE